jgi:hypothetical protein
LTCRFAYDSVPFKTMARLRARKSLVVLAAVLVVFAGVVPLIASLPALVLTPLWFVFTTAAGTLIRRRAVRCDEQVVPLLSLVASRAPPALA